MSQKHDDAEFDQLIDRAAERIRGAALPSDAAAAAADRARAAIFSTDVPVLDGCDAYQASMAAALAGELPAARRQLIEEHTRECVVCRRAWNAARSGVSRTDAPAPRVRRGAFRYVAAAAAAIALVGLGAVTLKNTLFAPPARTASIAQAQGPLYLVKGEQGSPLAAQAVVKYGEGIRTAREGRAVVALADGTRIEMRERTELSLVARGRDTDIRLARGAIIVQAAHQGAGHLFVTTDDCRVAVIGTIFSVDQGTKGARVSVLRGEVHVTPTAMGVASDEAVLKPGDQFASNASVGRTPLATEVAWSQDRAQYDALLAELAKLDADFGRLPGPTPRHATRLLDMLPVETVLFASVPNVTGTVAEAHRMFAERLRASEPLRAWWQQRVGPQGEQQLEQAVATLQKLGEPLGDEIVVAITQPANAAAPHDGLVVLATVKDAARLRALIEEQLAKAGREADGHVRFVDDPAAAAPVAQNTLDIWMHDDLLVASPSRAVLAAVAGHAAGAAGGFAGTPFHERLARAYTDGVTWLAAVDLQRIVAMADAQAFDKGAAERRAALQGSGLADARWLFLEGHGEADRPTFEAALEFAGPRHGMASWLAAPAPMGSLAFVSPDAMAAGAIVVKDPARMLDDVFTMLADKAPQAREGFEKARAELGVDLQQDVLAALGGEVAVAIDGPLLPTPAWKLVVEVYDPARLQHALEALVQRADQELAKRPEAKHVALTREDLGGQAYYRVTVDGAEHASYTFADGYMVAAPQRALLERALQNRRAGLTITTATAFRSLLPKDREANFSALFYTDPTSLAKLAGQPGQAGADAGADAAQGEASRNAQTLGMLLASAKPGLEYAYASDDRISAAASGGRLGGLELVSLLGMRAHHADTPAGNTGTP